MVALRRPKLYRLVPTLLRVEQIRQQRMSTIKSKIATMTCNTSISNLNRCLSDAAYGHYGADDRHNHGRDSGDDGIEDTTDGRNDGTLDECQSGERQDYKRFWQDLITIITSDRRRGVRWKRSVVLRARQMFGEGPNPFPP